MAQQLKIVSHGGCNNTHVYIDDREIKYIKEIQMYACAGGTWEVTLTIINPTTTVEVSKFIEKKVEL